MPQISGGMGIVNPLVRHPGTIGLIAWRRGRPYIVSCYHVLCRLDRSDFVKGESIFLTSDGTAQELIADVEDGLVDIDVASAAVADGVEVLPGVVGLPPLGAPAEPKKGMSVVKVGHATNRTVGTIVDVDGLDVRIQGADGADISAGGDSGAVWVDAASWAPVALHTGTNRGGMVPDACAIKLIHVLGALKLVYPAPPQSPEEREA